jgi:hypothetical protein
MFRPGRSFCDVDGIPIQAHAASILRYGGFWYLYGQDMGGRHSPSDPSFTGISVYRSTDLMAWKRIGVALAPEPADLESPLHPDRIGERAKVIHNLRTNKFVMWLHLDRRAYDFSMAGVAVADSPEGPFKLEKVFRPLPVEEKMHPEDARRAGEGSAVLDTNLFVDRDGKAYFIYCSEGLATLHICELNEEFTDIRRPAIRGVTWARGLEGLVREAPAFFRWRDHVYSITSGCTGWEPNFLLTARAPSPLGPWELLGDPCIGPAAETGYASQPAWILPLEEHGPDAFLYLGDRWNQRDLESTAPVWLPFRMEAGKSPKLRFLPEWTLDIFRQQPAPPELENLTATPWDSRGAQMQPDSVRLSWKPTPGADGYSVFRNGSAVDFTTASEIEMPLGIPGVECVFSVKAWNLAGGYSADVSTSSFIRGKAREVFLSDIPWTRSWSAFCRIIRDESWEGGALSIGDRRYAKGLFVHAPADVEFDLGGVYRHFSCEAGVFTGLPGLCRCVVEGDGKILFQSTALNETTPSVTIEVDVAGVLNLVLRVEGLGRGPLDGRFVWGNARILP